MVDKLNLFSLENKVAWVTGASYGLGFAYAKAYAEVGARIVFNDINEELVNRGIENYKKEGIYAYGAVCDVTNEEQVKDFVNKVKKEVGPIDILVNNAGIIKRIPMHEMEVKDWKQVIDIDLTGPFICSKAVLPSMMERGHGKIINACSMMSEFGRETVSAYAAAKGGLKMLTRNICSEYGQYNIQCNAIGPGYIATPQTAPLRERGEDGSMNPFDRFIRSKTPAQRWGRTEDLEGLAIFLASQASDFINGQVIYIDGGISAYIGQDPGNLDESKFISEIEADTDIKTADK
ncbi:MAG: gluconate 5-dehydrogenase [Lachnospiraceae bacterium]|nr:gluconate 5-dehydrogenase [Lachnospiraceae bacterium]